MKLLIVLIIAATGFASFYANPASATTKTVSGEVSKPKIDRSQIMKSRLVREIKTTERRITTLKGQITRLENLMQTARMTKLALARNTRQLTTLKQDLAKAESRLAELKRALALL